MADKALSRTTSARKSRRKTISKKTRFEVFKRDKFTCQYCGVAAPDAVLHVDHIHPVAKGGDNSITNLIASCRDCNLGKGPRKISDESALSKQRKQLEDLQERREQIEMMASWRRGLAELEEEQISTLSDLLIEETGYKPNERGRSLLRKWVKKFGFAETSECASISFSQYFDDCASAEEAHATWEHAFNMIPRIATVRASGGMDENKRRAFYTRGILRNRLSYINERDVLDLIQDAFEAGADPDQVENLARRVSSWGQFRGALLDWIIEHEEAGE